MSARRREERISLRAWRHARVLLSVCATSVVLAACASQFGGTQTRLQPTDRTAVAPVGEGQVRVAVALPLSAQGNAGVAAQSMRNAAEMALAEFKSPNVQLLVKDDGGTPQGAQAAAQQAISEGAEIIIGPLFAQSVSAVGQAA